MKARHLAVVLAVLLISVCAAAQPAATPAPQKPQEKATTQPPQVTEQQRKQWGQQVNELRERLLQANVSEERKLLAVYVLGAEVAPFDPGHVMAVREELKLTPEQIAKLEEVEQQGFQRTREILNEEQRGKIEKLETVLVLNVARQAAPLIGMPRPGAPMPPAQPPAAMPPATRPPAPTPPATTPPATSPPAK